MPQTTLHVRMDSQLKKQFEDICADLGMTPSVAIDIFAQTVVRERRIPFEIAAFRDSFYREPNISRLRESIGQLDNGSCSTHEAVSTQNPAKLKKSVAARQKLDDLGIEANDIHNAVLWARKQEG